MIPMRIRTIIDKEWAEVFKNRVVLFTVGLLPLILTIGALGQLAATAHLGANQNKKLPENITQLCQQQGLAANDCLQGFLANQFMLIFLLVPMIVPVMIAAYSIVGEKTTRSLEPLLATPVSVSEIILGKSIAAVLPAVVATWLSFGIFQIGAYFIVSDAVHGLIADRKWWIAMLLLAPLLAVLSVNVAIMVSARVNDPRAAEQLGMLVILPLLGLFFAQAFGWATLTLGGILGMAGVLLALDAVMVVIGTRLFQRETILTRWR